MVQHRQASRHPSENAFSSQSLLLSVGDTVYALDIYAVEEVVRMAALTTKPGAPPWLAGYLNLRGDVLPVVDLRSRLRNVVADVDLDNLIVIVRDGKRRTGLVVDQVRDVVELGRPLQDSRVTRHNDVPVFYLDPRPFIEEAYAV